MKLLPSKRTLKAILLVVLLPLAYEYIGNNYFPGWTLSSFFPPRLQPGYDFIIQSPYVKWSNGSKPVDAVGRNGDPAGYVFCNTSVPVLSEDGTKYDTFLETHPEWAPLGRIEGFYGPFTISKNLKVQCRVGFLAGREVTKGAAFRVYFKGKGDSPLFLLEERIKTFDKKLVSFDVPLDRVADKKGYIVLAVQDLGDSDADSPIWTIAKTTD